LERIERVDERGEGSDDYGEGSDDFEGGRADVVCERCELLIALESDLPIPSAPPEGSEVRRDWTEEGRIGGVCFIKDDVEKFGREGGEAVGILG